MSIFKSEIRKQIIYKWKNPNKIKKFELIKRYQNNKIINDSFQQIPNETKNDINIDDVFKKINYTCSSIGEQYLYHKITTIKDEKSISQFNKIIEKISANQELKLELAEQLYSLRFNNAYYICDLFQQEQINKPKSHLYAKLSASCFILCIILGAIFPKFIIGVILFALVNVLIHNTNRKFSEAYIPSFSYLNSMCFVAENCTKKLKFFPEINNYLYDLKKLRKKTKYFSLLNSLKQGSEFSTILWMFLDLLNSLTLSSYFNFYSLLDSIEKNKYNVENIFEIIGKIDSAISVTLYRESLETWCEPKISKEKIISATNISHPLIENCIPNNFIMKEKGVLITGSNMSGKTTFLRSIALNVLLGQTINTCLANQIQFPLTKIFSTITIQDNIEQGASYYLAEVLAVKTLINEAQKEEISLIILDELFKGTNTIERISSAKAVLEFLNKSNNFVCVSSHDIELLDYLAEDYDFYHFEETIKENKLCFDHKLKSGPFTTRNAIKILAMYDYPQEIVNSALELSQRIDKLTVKLQPIKK